MKDFKLISKFTLLAIFALPLTVKAEAEVQNFNVGHGETLLILAPHPDDETLSAGGMVQQVLAHGGYVRSVVVTSGDAYVDAIEQATGRHNLKPKDFLHFGEQRLEESRKVARFFGNSFIHLDLLGYSDGSIYDMLVSHWQRSHPERSEFTGVNHIPYQAAEDKGWAQDGHDLLTELVTIMKETKPTIVVFPDVMEDDSDHAGLGMFALLAVNEWLEYSKKAETEPHLLAYLIHWPSWPPGSDLDKPIDASDKPLFLPSNLPVRNHTRTCLNLSKDETHIKHLALGLYKTQQRIMAPFLEAFVHTNECFSQLKVTDTDNIEKIVKQWQHVRKQFSSRPNTRRKI